MGAPAGAILICAVGAALLVFASSSENFVKVYVFITLVSTVAALVLIPLALAASAERKPPGTWQDFATILMVWLAVKPLPNPWGWSSSHSLWPYPGGRLAYWHIVEVDTRRYESDRRGNSWQRVDGLTAVVVSKKILTGCE